jgi:hypothetical protein
VEEPDANGEDLVEAALAEIRVLGRGHQELGDPRLDEGRVPEPRRLDHLGRAVDRDVAAAVKSLADHRRRHAVPAADLEQPVGRLDVKRLHRPLQARASQLA